MCTVHYFGEKVTPWPENSQEEQEGEGDELRVGK